ncbi:pectinesterase inhibitor 9-like [Herrania umbratica]|uniref:Pectinesterase inhibitor 9-like n=1 Tax=Herrania umbratica TaxID=108875 RepID=A0A6J0ZZW1_9ROSI|nr:pectinesterase inhibitor 9-like [Herrania umbratica]
MAKHSLSLVLFFLFIFRIAGTVEPSMARPRHPRHSQARTFIESSCQTTRYPALCIKCLSGYANSRIRNAQQLAEVALTVSLYKARYTRSYMLKVAKKLEAMKAREYPVVRDCLQQIDDSVNQLSQSIRELRGLDSKARVMTDDVFWHMNNVETWVSAALTDASSCVDQFPGHRMSKMKATIKGKVMNVEQLTSNALALFHRYAARYGTAATKKPKP